MYVQKWNCLWTLHICDCFRGKKKNMRKLLCKLNSLGTGVQAIVFMKVCWETWYLPWRFQIVCYWERGVLINNTTQVTQGRQTWVLSIVYYSYKISQALILCNCGESSDSPVCLRISIRYLQSFGAWLYPLALKFCSRFAPQSSLTSVCAFLTPTTAPMCR